MKSRQKLAMVLAVAMIMTMVPVVTMAKTDSSLTNNILTAEKNTQVTAGALKIKMKDAVDTTETIFFINLGNAEWTMQSNTLAEATAISGGALTDIMVRYQKNTDKELQVTVKKVGSSDGIEDFLIPLTVKLTGGDATVAIDGADTVISDMSALVFAKASAARVTVSAVNVKNFYQSGIIADVIIEEPFKALLGTHEVKVRLDNSDYKFDQITKENIELSKGFGAGIAITPINLNASGDEFKFSLTNASDMAAGRITLKGIKVKIKSGKKPVVGESIAVIVSSEKMNEALVKVAESQDLNNIIEMKNKTAVNMTAGGKKDITFSIKENIGNTILDTRTIAVRLDKGFLFNDVITSEELSTHSLINTLVKKVVIGNYPNFAAVQNFELVTNRDDEVIGFDFKVKPNVLKANQANEIKFSDVTVYMPVNETGEVNISAEGRGVGDKIKTKALHVKAPVEVSSEAYILKVGFKDQKGGKLVIKESTANTLKQRKDLRITIDGKAAGIKLTDKPVVKVSGDLRVNQDKIQVTAAGDEIIIPIESSSKIASTITITDILVSVDHTVPEGKYDLKINGSALEEDYTSQALTIKDFIVIDALKIEEPAANRLKKVVSTFAVESKKYTVNGVQQVMDAASYINNGRTMVPIRYVANALGIKATEIYFANGTVTVIAGTKTISLQVGSKAAKLNDAAARVMETAPVIKEGRAYVPVSEIGTLLGVDARWDNAKKVATFENK